MAGAGVGPGGSTAHPALSIPNGAPKFGTLVPNRVFVGGISSTTTESELHSLFSAFGNVKQTKIIQDRAGVSKGYGFVTFETEEEARRLQVQADNIMLKERKLNIAPAIKKQQTYSKPYDMGQPILNGGYYYSPSVSGTPYTYHNGLAMFTADTGQHTALGLALQQLPAKGAAAAQSATQPFPLLYGPSGAATTAMFLPTAGSAAAAQAAAVASVTQQQLQLQTAAATAAHINSINNVAAAAQSPTREAGKGGHGHDTSTSVGAGGSQPWRWTALTSGGAAAAGQPQVSCGPSAVTQHQAAAAVQAASLHAGSAAGGVTAGQLTGTPAAANHHLATQPGLNYAAQGANSGFIHPLETFHYIPSVFSTGLQHPGFVIPTPERQNNY